MLDFVYIVKEDEHNEDLRYSLRSIAKYYPENKVWIVGYKPSWVKNVNYLPIEQSGDKWKNSINNILAACNCSDISNDFILMNDDFFMIKPLVPIEMMGNTTLGLLSNSIMKYKTLKSSWHNAFGQVQALLKKLNVPEPYYDFEIHAPLKINKQKFLEVMNLPEVQKFMQTSQVLHKRTLYKNYDKPETLIKLPADVKVTQTFDDSESRLKICGWLSVYDKQIGNPKFYSLNGLLKTNFPKPGLYEKEITAEEKSKLKNINIDGLTVHIPNTYEEMPIKRKDFIHF